MTRKLFPKEHSPKIEMKNWEQYESIVTGISNFIVFCYPFIIFNAIPNTWFNDF